MPDHDPIGSSATLLTSFNLSPGQEAQGRIISTAKRMLHRNPNMQIRLHWAPGHTNVEGNELADEAAKQATKMACRVPKSSLPFLKRMINERRTSEWQEHLRGLKEKPNTYSQSVKDCSKPRKSLPKILFPRKTISAFYQLKIGHGYFRSYLKRFAGQESDRCSCGNRQTPAHLLLECKEYREQRRTLKDKLRGLRLSLPLLLNSKLGLIPTLTFLRDTGISTREWMLEPSESD